MNEAVLAIKILELGLLAAEKIEGLVTDAERRSIQERIDRAKASIKDPIDPSDDDKARRERLERAIRGEG